MIKILIFMAVALFSIPVSATTYAEAYAFCLNQKATVYTDPDQYGPCFFTSACPVYGNFVGNYLIQHITQSGCDAVSQNPVDEDCVSPEVFDPETNSCAVPPASCSLGEIKELVVQHGKSQDGFFNLNMQVAGSSGTAVFDGCSYSYVINAGSECLSNVDLADATLLYCKVTATNSGNAVSAGTPPNSFASADVPVSARRENDPDGCFTNASGVKACPIATTSANCAKINGVDVCAKTPGQGSPVDFGGHVVAELPADGKNCARGSNGNAVCNEIPTIDGTVQSQKVQLIKDDGSVIALSTIVKEHTFTASVTNIDGSVTTETVTDNNVIGDSSQKVIRTVYPDGSVAETTEGVKPGSESTPTPNNGIGTGEISPGDDSAMEGIFASSTAALTSSVDASDAVGQWFFWPAQTECQTVPMNYKSLHYTFSPCGKLQTFRALLGWLMYVMTAFSIFELAMRSNR